MSKTSGKKSKPEDGNSKSPSVLDFLYHDHRRIGSFLSQFEETGVLSQVTHSNTAQENEETIASHSADLGVPGVVKGKTGVDERAGSGLSDTSHRVYDPFWSNARAFLDFLSDKDMLEDNINNAKIGQFVIVSGYLSILDLVMFKEAWKMKTIQRKMMDGIAPSRKMANMTAAQRDEAKESKENAELFIELMQVMPHAVHARLLEKADERTNLIWCTLQDEYLVAPASDISLTHGANMSGEWSIVGILSAYPEYSTPDMSTQFDETDMGMTQSIIGQLSNILSPMVRIALGRPSAAHAVTPLLIFRSAN